MLYQFCKVPTFSACAVRLDLGERIYQQVNWEGHIRCWWKRGQRAQSRTLKSGTMTNFSYMIPSLHLL
jgi:hypothetical protein